MFLKYFNIKKNNLNNQTSSLYKEIVYHSNNFVKINLNNRDINFNDVFEIFSIVTIFYLKKLKDKKTEESKKISQIIIDCFIKDLDQHFREQGIGDMSIGKYVKKYVKKFYYRLKILDAVFEENKKLDFNYFLKKIGIFADQDNTKISDDLKNLYYDISIENNKK